ncbi:hypothetical protein PMAYCL1PPCAC_20236, partial [Pristionchus mayeri]
ITLISSVLFLTLDFLHHLNRPGYSTSKASMEVLRTIAAVGIVASSWLHGVILEVNFGTLPLELRR